MTVGEETCGICKERKNFTHCIGCGISLCESCSCFELIGSGCGCVWPAYYCPPCSRNPLVNPNAFFKETEQGGRS